MNLTQKANLLPAFLEGSQTLFVGQGSEIAYVDFGRLKGSGHPGVGEPDGGHDPAAPGRSSSPPCSTSGSPTSSPSSRGC